MGHSLRHIERCRSAPESVSPIAATADQSLLTILDRGPFVRGRIIDLTPAAARVIGVYGLAMVDVEVE